MKLKVILHPEEEGGYSVEVPALPGCFSEGETLEEALANIKDAISEYLAAQPEIEERFGVKIQRAEVTV